MTKYRSHGRFRSRKRFGQQPVLSIYQDGRGVAQPGSAPALGAGGRWFKSSRPDHFFLAGDPTTPACFSFLQFLSSMLFSARKPLLRMVFLLPFLCFPLLNLACSKGVYIKKSTGENSLKGQTSISAPASGIALKDIRSVPEIVSAVADRTVVYVGEQHERYGDHLVQLEMIKGLRSHHPKLAIGMEMFQRSHQKALDDYVEGLIDEKTFLRESEYFSTWGYNYYLYRDVLHYARSGKIPVAALNVDRDIAKKVAREGIEGLSPEERAGIPGDIDFSDEDYKERLKAIFERHEKDFLKTDSEANFQYFYQAQLIWDEGMAESIAGYLTKHPDHCLVVLAGNGHLAYGSGIPKRVHRRTGKSYAIVLSRPGGPLEPGMADFVSFPQDVEAPSSPRLMVNIDDTGGVIKVVGLPHGSVAKAGGMQKDDIIVALDDQEIKNIDDLKAALFDRKAGETIKVRVLRGEKEEDLAVTLKDRTRTGAHKKRQP